eukprot:scaffold1.g5316.t1
MAVAQLPSLRQQCLQRLAGLLLPVPSPGSGSSIDVADASSAIVLLPAELRLELLLLLARWGLLTATALDRLRCDDFLTSLVSLSFAGCALLPSGALGQLASRPLPRLTSLNLRGCAQLTDAEAARALQQCPGLTSVELSKCPLIGMAAIGELATLPGLAALGLARCWQVADLSPLAACRRLRSLNVSGCCGVDPAGLRRVVAACAPCLEDLNISGCWQLGDALLPSVALTRLRSLDGSGSGAGAPTLAWVALWCCATLQCLLVANCSSATGQGVAAVLAAKRMLLVGPSSGGVLPLVELSAAGLGSWHKEGEPSWRELLLSAAQLPLDPACCVGGIPVAQPPLDVSRLGDADVSREAGPPAPAGAAGVLACLGDRGLEQLQTLSLGSGATDAVLEVLTGRCPNLQRLLIGGSRVSDGAVGSLLAGLGQLRELDLAGCTGRKVARPGSRFAARSAKRMQEGGVSDSALAPLPSCNPQLQSLNLGGLLVTDAALVRLRGLTSVQLRGCGRVTDSGVLHLLQQSPGMRRVDAVGCQLSAGAFGCWAAAPQPAAGGQFSAGTQQTVISSVSHLSLERMGLPAAAGTDATLVWLAGAARPATSALIEHTGCAKLWRGLGCPAGSSPLCHLELSSGHSITEAGLLLCLSHCPQLRVVAVVAAAGLTGAICGALNRHCPLLARVSLPGWAVLTDADVAQLLGLVCLQQLDLSRGSGLSDAALLEALQASAATSRSRPSAAVADAIRAAGPAPPHRLLRSVKLDGAARISDAGAIVLVEACAELEHLSLRRLPLVGDATAAAAMRRCANLQVLQLGGTGVKGAFLAQLGVGCGAQPASEWPEGVAARRLRRMELPARVTVDPLHGIEGLQITVA